MDGQPPTPSISTRAGPGARAAGCPLGSWHARVARLLAAGLSWRPSRFSSSPFGAALASVCVASASQDSLSASPRLLSRLQFVPKRPPAAGQEEQGGGGAPLGVLDLEPGKREPWTPGDARSPQHPRGTAGEDETATSIVSVCQVRQENWGGCWRGGGAQLGSAGRGVPWQCGFSHPNPHLLPLHLPTPTPRLWWPRCWVPGLQ